MKKYLIAAAAISVLAGAAPAFAQSSASIGYSRFNIDPYNIDAVTGRYGWTAGNFGLEGEASFGVSDDTVGTTTVKMNHDITGFATAQGNISPDFSILGRVGYGQTSVESAGVTTKDEGVAYGAGATWTPGGGPNGVRVDYTKHDFGDVDSDVWSLSLMRRF